MTCSSDDGSDDDEPVPTALHVCVTLWNFAIFCFSIQQLLGAPTIKKKVFRYRSTVAVSTFTALILAVSLNFELEQDKAQAEGKDSFVSDQFVYFVNVLFVVWLSEALVLGYWFLIDAVGAAYKATHGINQVQPPGWIRKFWLIVIVSEQSILVLLFIFAFVMQNTFFLSVLYMTGFGVGAIGSVVILGCVFSVHRSINTTTAGGQTQTTNDLKKAKKTLTIMLIFGIIFCVIAVGVFSFILSSLIRNACLQLKNLDSKVLDNWIAYLRYMAIVNVFNMILILWTYRSSNINYCCFCWTYKKYTTGDYRNQHLDESVLCYRFFPMLIESAEDRRQRIIEDSAINNSNENT